MIPNNKAGGEIDSYCGKCDLLLAHVIIAMNGTRVARVECKTCHAVHAYRGDPDKITPVRKSASTHKASLGASDFDQLMKNRDLTRAIRYKPSHTFVKDDIVDHPSFGLGLVTKLQSDNKIEAVFRSGPKILVHARK